MLRVYCAYKRIVCKLGDFRLEMVKVLRYVIIGWFIRGDWGS